MYSWVIDIMNVQEIRRFLYVEAQVTPVVIQDADADGVPDDQDAFPLDPSRSAIVRLPASGAYTVAYEDLYPVQGDADSTTMWFK